MSFAGGVLSKHDLFLMLDMRRVYRMNIYFARIKEREEIP